MKKGLFMAPFLLLNGALLSLEWEQTWPHKALDARWAMDRNHQGNHLALR
jgi:hypothetical protein